VLGDPVNWGDPSGLDVEICMREADLPLNWLFGFEHWWLRTDTMEAGAGPAAGGVPGQGGSDSPYATDMTVNDHTGQGDAPGSVCEEVPPGEGVDEQCVNRMLQFGRGLGGFSAWNNCQSFVMEVLFNCGYSIDPNTAATPP